MNASDTQQRIIVATSDRSHSLTLNEPMVWYNDASQKRGVMLPQGIYTAEGEDNDFWYFRAPVPMDFRIFDKPGGDNERHIPGGIALRKNVDLLVPAEVYIDADPGNETKKDLILKLGQVFADLQGSKWIKNF